MMQMEKSQSEATRRQMMVENRKNIESDAVRANQSGVSYGKYKAGMLERGEDSEYKAHSSDHLKRNDKKEEKEDKKVSAFIK